MFIIFLKVIYEIEKVFFEFFVSFFVKRFLSFLKKKIKFRFGWVGLRINRLIIKVMIIWLNDEFSLI